MESSIELFLIITGNYMKYAGVTILSVLENVSRRVNVKILCTDVSDEDRDIIGSMTGKFDAGVEFMLINSLLLRVREKSIQASKPPSLHTSNPPNLQYGEMEVFCLEK